MGSSVTTAQQENSEWLWHVDYAMLIMPHLTLNSYQ